MSEPTLRKKASHNEGETSILETSTEFEVIEHDKTGNVQRRWLHTPDNRVTPVSITQDMLLSRSK